MPKKKRSQMGSPPTPVLQDNSPQARAASLQEASPTSSRQA